ncbi:MAG: hypothetical protein HS117_17325 [Verrucomicrobiaceae bacterium]|jgi:hypothetical protein|nr:hypothetical protein [Verrucomicrobiaceae bacterium]
MSLPPMIRAFWFLVLLCVPVACVPLRKVDPGAHSILVATEQSRECKAARVIFPAGEYSPEVSCERGTYYLAPARLRTEGVLLGGGYRGGLFIGRDGKQAAWFGDARDAAEERPSTLLGAVGASAPKLWPFQPVISVTPVPASAVPR